MIKNSFFRKSIYTLICCCVAFFYGITIEAMPPKKGGREREDSDRPTVASASVSREARAGSDSDEEGQLSAGSYSPREQFADPTTDTAFKQLLSLGIGSSDYSIAVSFLNCFVPAFERDPIAHLEEQPVAIPVLRRKGEKQAFMDFHVTTQKREHVVVEMQVKRHVLFDERALFYAAATYSRQLSEKEFSSSDWYKDLRPTYAVQILGYDSNRVRGITGDEVEDTLPDRVREHPLEEGNYVKHYMMTDQHSGQTIDYLQMIQIELPRVKKTLFPPQQEFTEKDWWLSLFKHAKEYTRELLDELDGKEIKMPESIQRAFGRLEMSEWEPQLVRKYVKDELDLQNYSSVLAAERAIGQEIGERRGQEIGQREERIRTAQSMIEDQFTNDVIARLTKLSLEEIEALRSPKE